MRCICGHMYACRHMCTHAHTHTHTHNPYMHMYSHASMHGMMRMDGASHHKCIYMMHVVRVWARVSMWGHARTRTRARRHPWHARSACCMHVPPHGAPARARRMGAGALAMCGARAMRHPSASYHACMRARGARWAGAPCVMDVIQTRTMHMWRLLGWCPWVEGACSHALTERKGTADGLVPHGLWVCIFIACTHMLATYTCTCTCVTHLKTTQHVSAACCMHVHLEQLYYIMVAYPG